MFDDFEEAGGFSSVNHCETFKCYRHLPDGDGYEVKVEVFDIGPNSLTPMRYWVIATRQSDGKQMQGNAAPTVKEALRVVHWWVIDNHKEDEQIINEEGEPS